MSDVDRLIRFVAVAEDLSFSKAARRLNVDQPWLSRQILQLEEQLDLALFVRSSRRVALTAEGFMLLERAKLLVEAADACQAKMREMAHAKRSVIALGVGPYTYWLPNRRRLLGAFRDANPDALIDVTSELTPRLISKLRQRELDAIIIPDGPAGDDLESLVIENTVPALVIPAEDPLAQAGSLRIEQLAGKRIAITDPRLNPTMHELHYQPFIDAGAIPVIVPEGQAAIPFHARSARIIAVNLGGPVRDMQLASDFVHVPLAGPIHRIRYSLVRRREQPGALLNQFWSVAISVVQGAAPEPHQAARSKLALVA